MIVFELHGVEVDYCPACGGTWLDAGELEQIAAVSGAPTARLTEALRRARDGDKSQRRCPRCRRRMRALQVGEASPVTLDRCTAGHGLWFDRGELESLIRQCGEGEHEAIARFFGDLFRHEMGGEGQV